LCYLNLFSQIRNLKVEGPSAPEKKCRGLSPCGPSGSATYAYVPILCFALLIFELVSVFAIVASLFSQDKEKFCIVDVPGDAGEKTECKVSVLQRKTKKLKNPILAESTCF